MTTLELTTLSRGWPWSFAEVAAASEIAEAAGWSVAQLVGFLDAVAQTYGPAARPASAVGVAVQVYRRGGIEREG